MPPRRGKSGNPSTQFTRENQPKNKGRRKTCATQFLERVKIDIPDMIINKTDYFDILKILLSCNKDYISKLVEDENIPVSILCVIKAIKADIDEGTTKTIDSLMDRLFGKTIRTELTGAEGKDLIPSRIDMSTLTNEQLEALASIRIKKDEEEK